MHFNYVLRSSLLLVSMELICCAPNDAILKSNSNQAAAEPTVVANSQPAYDTVEGEVENMRTADFDFILVLRRKDGGEMQSDDKAFVRTNMPNANRRSLVDGGKAIVIGANAEALGDVVKKLYERFDVRDFSKPKAENKNSNSSANANIGH
jgi:hypothetical protein